MRTTTCWTDSGVKDDHISCSKARLHLPLKHFRTRKCLLRPTPNVNSFVMHLTSWKWWSTMAIHGQVSDLLMCVPSQEGKPNLGLHQSLSPAPLILDFQKRRKTSEEIRHFAPSQVPRVVQKRTALAKPFPSASTSINNACCQEWLRLHALSALPYCHGVSKLETSCASTGM